MSNSIYSIGQAAALIQAMPDRIRAAAESLCIDPAVRINGVDHFDEKDVELISDYLRAHATP